MTRKWHEMLRMHPIIDRDREEFVDRTDEAEKTTANEANAIRAEKQQPLHKCITIQFDNRNRNYKAMHANSFMLGFGVLTNCP